jgi:hypothetical protein
MSMLVRRELREELLRSGRRGDQLGFGRAPELAFVQLSLHRRTKRAWMEAGLVADGRPLGSSRRGCTMRATTV